MRQVRPQAEGHVGGERLMSISLEFPESVLEAIAERAAAKVRHDVTDLSEPSAA